MLQGGPPIHMDIYLLNKQLRGKKFTRTDWRPDVVVYIFNLKVSLIHKLSS